MSESVATPDHILLGAADSRLTVPWAMTGSVSAWASSRLEEVEAVWQRLERRGIESPGQSLPFIRSWAKALGIAEADQLYIVGQVDGIAVALLPLLRRRRHGVRVLSWFPGSHVGCNAPLIDRDRLAALTPVQRRDLWARMRAEARDADVLYLKAVPELVVDGVDLFDGLGTSLPADTLYRAEFSSWAEADTTQRGKTRRKHDRQQGDKLEAMGRVTFEQIEAGPEHLPILELMFRQRGARFSEMGIRDPFCMAGIRRFYDSTIGTQSGLKVVLHVLRLDGEIVALRYNIAHGDRLFCLISSMSTQPRLQPGSPGKQCLLRVMQSVFDCGYRMFDMGAGLTDEKRHWCNVQIPVREVYAPLSPAGQVAAALHQSWKQLRRRIKDDPRLFGAIKSIRSRLPWGAGP